LSALFVSLVSGLDRCEKRETRSAMKAEENSTNGEVCFALCCCIALSSPVFDSLSCLLSQWKDNEDDYSIDESFGMAHAGRVRFLLSCRISSLSRELLSLSYLLKISMPMSDYTGSPTFKRKKEGRKLKSLIKP
jgi:hypothetical protein